VISSWVILPLALCAIAALGFAGLLMRERRVAAQRLEHEEALAMRVADLEAANVAAQAALDELMPQAEFEAALSGDRNGEVSAALTDEVTGLFNEQFFRVTLETRVSAARRHLRPVAVVLVQVSTGVREGAPEPTEPALVSEGVRATLRDADTACRLDDGRFALILEDTPENGAVWTVERIRRALAGGEAPFTLWAGIACYPAHAFDAWELFERAAQALAAACEWQQDRIEVATAD
jgi:two-component system cell cycle response regulator